MCHSEPRPRLAVAASFIPEPSIVISSPTLPSVTHSSSIPSASTALHPTTSHHLPEPTVGMPTPSVENSEVTAISPLPVPLNAPQNSASTSTHPSSTSHGSASTCPQPSPSASSGIVPSSLAASFGLALGSFLYNRR